MPSFKAFDGTSLSYQSLGSGDPLLCLPGGPMRDPVYLGDLGGVTAERRLIRFSPRGTGASAAPRDETTYRCDRQTDDVEAIRRHLGLDRMDIFAHSAGANLAALYAVRYPQHVDRLVLGTPSGLAVGLAGTAEQRMAIANLRTDEPWYPAAASALRTLAAGDGGSAEWEAIAPLFYGRWDATARTFQQAGASQQNQQAAAIFNAPGAYNPDHTVRELRTFDRPVLIIGGEFDVAAVPPRMREYAGLFRGGQLVLQPAAGHYPWLDDPARFSRTITTFLASA